eukprot:6308890-Alexandrium_andersonii.AAC.1
MDGSFEARPTSLPTPSEFGPLRATPLSRSAESAGRVGGPSRDEQLRGQEAHATTASRTLRTLSTKAPKDMRP